MKKPLILQQSPSKKSGRFPILTLLRCLLILNTRNNSRGGGVGFYLYDSLDFSVLRNHSLFIVKEFECLTTETFLHGKKVILSNIYRPLTPTPNISVTSQIVLFINRLDSHLLFTPKLTQTHLFSLIPTLIS
jgi:hypothetical protein